MCLGTDLPHWTVALLELFAQCCFVVLIVEVFEFEVAVVLSAGAAQ